MYFKKTLLLLPLLFLNTIISAQNIKAKVIDQKTNQPIPYATIQLSNDQGIITNEEGRFSLTLKDKIAKVDSIYISSMGYEKRGFSIQNEIDTIIALNPKAIELSGVFVSNKNLTAEEVIDNVKARISQNYNFDLSQKHLFFRESDFSKIKKLDIKFKKSTIKELDKKLMDSIISILPKKTEFYTEMLGEYSSDANRRKLHISKAAELYDKNNSISMDALSEKMEAIFKKNIKPNSYLKIKSGWFGTKVQVDSILENDKNAEEIKDQMDEQKKKEDKSEFQNRRKESLNNILSSFFYNEDVKSNFLNKSNRYKFELNDYTYIEDQSVYIIDFVPKRSEDFKGTLYINTEDFAIVRVDYENVKPLKNFKLLGVHYQDKLYRNKLIFSKNQNNKYDLKYLELYRGKLFGFDRPLKVIEKNKFVKGKRKQNELSLDINFVTTNTLKYEIVVFDSKLLSESDYTNLKENKAIKPTYLSKYSSEFWKGYTIIEPNSAIRQFTVAPESE